MKRLGASGKIDNQQLKQRTLTSADVRIASAAGAPSLISSGASRPRLGVVGLKGVVRGELFFSFDATRPVAAPKAIPSHH